jgi:Rad3-related DNA helicase
MAEEYDVEQEMPAVRTLRQALTEALGLPAETFLLELLLGETTPPVVRCHYYPSEEAMQRAVVVLAEYQLVAKQSGTQEEEVDPASEASSAS